MKKHAGVLNASFALETPAHFLMVVMMMVTVMMMVMVRGVGMLLDGAALLVAMLPISFQLQRGVPNAVRL